jgi:chromosomal replication initiator protein
MKQEVFNQFVEKVSSLFDIKKEEFFSKSKKREHVDARQLVYYLCAKRPMQITYIEKYMNEAGYKITHSTIIHGIKAVESRMIDDRDYVAIVKDLERSVNI